MMRRNRLAIVAVTLLSGCAPLQQAALVYSSQLVVGVDVSTTSAANPGANISIGVRSTDLAYVPVAVAASAPSNSTTNLEIIRADFGQDESGNDQKQISNERDKKLAAYDDSLKKLSAAQLQLKTNADTLAASQTQKAAVANALLAISGAGAVPPSPPAAPQVAAPSAAAASAVVPDPAALYAQVLEARVTTLKNTLQPALAFLPSTTVANYLPLQATVDLTPLAGALQAYQTAINTQVDAQTKNVTDAQSAVNDANAYVASARAALEQVERLLATKKKDAMSVFGSFGNTASGSASSPAATLSVGKVFSTGLASQNLTEAAKTGAVAACLTNGLAAAAAAASGATPTERVALANVVANACAVVAAK